MDFWKLSRTFLAGIGLCLRGTQILSFCALAFAEQSKGEFKMQEMERTLAIIKPNAVKNHHAGEILARYESKGFLVVAGKLIHMTQEKAEGFYAEHRQRPFFKSLVEFMSSGPVWVLALQAKNAVLYHREVIGATDPAKAEPGTIRKDFGESIDANAVHGSDSVASAAREIGYFFSPAEMMAH